MQSVMQIISIFLIFSCFSAIYTAEAVAPASDESKQASPDYAAMSHDELARLIEASEKEGSSEKVKSAIAEAMKAKRMADQKEKQPHGPTPVVVTDKSADAIEFLKLTEALEDPNISEEEKVKVKATLSALAQANRTASKEKQETEENTRAESKQ